MQSRANLPTTRSTVGSSAINKPMRPNSTPSVLPVAKSNNAFGVDFPDDDASFSQLCDVLNLLECKFDSLKNYTIGSGNDSKVFTELDRL